MFREIAEELMRAGAGENLLAMAPAYVYHARKESDIYVDGCVNDLLDFWRRKRWLRNRQTVICICLWSMEFLNMEVVPPDYRICQENSSGHWNSEYPLLADSIRSDRELF